MFVTAGHVTEKPRPELSGPSSPRSSSQHARGPAYLRVAAQQQSFLLQQADEVVADGGLEGSNHDNADEDGRH